MSTPIPSVQNTQNIRTAQFVKIAITFTNGTAQTVRNICFSTTFRVETFGGDIYSELGGLVGIGSSARDLTTTSSDTSVVITGLDSKYVYFVAGGPTLVPVPVTGQADIPVGYYPLIKGSIITISRGFYDATFTTLTPVIRFTGLITSYNIQEDRDTSLKANSDVWSIQLNCSSYRKVLENRLGGRFTEQQSWQYWSSKMNPALPLDTSMNNVAALEYQQFDFGKQVVSGDPGSASTSFDSSNNYDGA